MGKAKHFPLATYELFCYINVCFFSNLDIIETAKGLVKKKDFWSIGKKKRLGNRGRVGKSWNETWAFGKRSCSSLTLIADVTEIILV